MRRKKASFVNYRSLAKNVVEQWVEKGLVKFDVVAPFFGYFKIHESVLGAMGLLRFLNGAIPNNIDPNAVDDFYSGIVELYSVVGAELGYVIDSTSVEQASPTVAFDSDGNVWYGFGVRLIPITDDIPSQPVLDAGKEFALQTIDQVFPSAVESMPKGEVDEDVPYIGNWEFTQPVMTQTNKPFDAPVPGMEGVMFPDITFVVKDVDKEKGVVTIEYLPDGDKETVSLDELRKMWIKWIKLP